MVRAAQSSLRLRRECVLRKAIDFIETRMTLNSAVAKGATTPPPSSQAPAPAPLPGRGGWGEGKRLIRRGVASDFEVVTEESRFKHRVLVLVGAACHDQTLLGNRFSYATVGRGKPLLQRTVANRTALAVPSMRTLGLSGSKFDRGCCFDV